MKHYLCDRHFSWGDNDAHRKLWITWSHLLITRELRQPVMTSREHMHMSFVHSILALSFTYKCWQHVKLLSTSSRYDSYVGHEIGHNQNNMQSWRWRYVEKRKEYAIYWSGRPEAAHWIEARLLSFYMTYQTCFINCKRNKVRPCIDTINAWQSYSITPLFY